MNLIAFSRSRNCVITQYAALTGAMNIIVLHFNCFLEGKCYNFIRAGIMVLEIFIWGAILFDIRSDIGLEIMFYGSAHMSAYSKTCRKWQREHSAILSTFIKLPFVIKTFVLSIFVWPLKTCFTVKQNFNHISNDVSSLI